MKIEHRPQEESYAIQYEAHHIAPNLEPVHEINIVKDALSLLPSVINRLQIPAYRVTQVDELVLRIIDTETRPGLLIPSRSGLVATELPRTHVHKIDDLTLIAGALGAFVDNTDPYLEHMERSGVIGPSFPARRTASRSAKNMRNMLQELLDDSTLSLGIETPGPGNYL